MCFSAQASFTAATVLGIMGAYALKKAKREQLFLALVPVFFAVQQCFEGIVWLTYRDVSYAFFTTAATYGFCFFAFFFWPVWIPITVLRMEVNSFRQTLLQGILGLGTMVASILVFTMIQSGVQTTVSCSHIQYMIFLPEPLEMFGAVVYCIATITPFFISSKKWMPFFGIATLASVGISYFFYYAFFTSVWCFFAAVLSSLIIWLM